MTLCAREFLLSRLSYFLTPQCSSLRCSMSQAMQSVSASQKDLSVDAGILKQTLALHDAAAAFCQGLHDEIPQRAIETNRQYRVAARDNTAPRGRSLPSSLRTQQAREWWDMCTGSKLFPPLTLARKWLTAMRHDTQWQTIHIPEQIVAGWRDLACESGAKVSDFDLLASWIQLVGRRREMTNQFMIPSADLHRTEPRRLRSLPRSRCLREAGV